MAARPARAMSSSEEEDDDIVVVSEDTAPAAADPAARAACLQDPRLVVVVDFARRFGGTYGCPWPNFALLARCVVCLRCSLGVQLYRYKSAFLCVRVRLPVFFCYRGNRKKKEKK